MKIYNPMEVNGDRVRMKTTHRLHMTNAPKPRETDIPGSFDGALKLALGKVNNKQMQADSMVTRFIKGDTGVEIHDVMISVRKAEQSLAFTKAIRDRLLRAFSELQTMR